MEEKSKVDNTKKFFQNEEKKQKKKMRSKKEKFKVKQTDSLTYTFPFSKNTWKMNTENSFINLKYTFPFSKIV